MAVLEWLEETHPDPALLPADALGRAYVRGLCNHIACDVHPLNNMSVTNYLKEDLDADGDAILRWYTRWMHRGFTAIERQVAEAGGRHCYGDAPGMADCLLIPQMFNAFRFGVQMEPFPTLCSIYEHCNTLDAFIAANPANQPDTPPA
jgi:maleylacetoacetate isomerase